MLIVSTTHATRANISRRSVLAAIAECDRLGREAFLRKHGYRGSNRFHLEHEGRLYDSKAILGVAFGYEYDCPALRPDEFSGGAEHCERLLTRLGFTVRYGLRDKAGRLVEKARRAVARVFDAIVGLVSCSKSKGDTPCAARDLYTSWVFQRSVDYVERECDEWAILSAKHGLVDPDAVLAPYDETLSGAPKAVREEWNRRVREQIEARYAGKRVRFVLMAGSAYAGCVEGMDVEEPMKGMGTGYRRQWLAQHA